MGTGSSAEEAGFHSPGGFRSQGVWGMLRELVFMVSWPQTRVGSQVFCGQRKFLFQPPAVYVYSFSLPQLPHASKSFCIFLLITGGNFKLPLQNEASYQKLDTLIEFMVHNMGG